VRDEEEAAAAELLLQCIYSVSDPTQPLQGADADMLLQVLKLAARLEVACCIKAAGQELILRAVADDRQLSWEATVAAFALPTHSPALAAAARALRDAACDALHAELGDLDLAWLDAKRKRRLLLLPFEAMR